MAERTSRSRTDDVSSNFYANAEVDDVRVGEMTRTSVVVGLNDVLIDFTENILC